MNIGNLNESTKASPTFELWISQWRLAILEPAAAASVLEFILQSFADSPADDNFWSFLEEFGFEGVNDDTRKSGHQARIHRLLVQAASLKQLPAKKLLDHLSHCYSLSGNDRRFWHVAGEALDRPVKPASASQSALII